MVFPYVFIMASVMDGSPPEQAADRYDDIVYHTQPIESKRDRHNKSRKKYKEDRKRKKKRKRKRSYKCDKYDLKQRYQDHEFIKQSVDIQEYQFLESTLIDLEYNIIDYNQEFIDYIIEKTQEEKISDALMDEVYILLKEEEIIMKRHYYDKIWKEYKRFHDDISRWKDFRKKVNYEYVEFNITNCPLCLTKLDIRFNRKCPLCGTCPCGYPNCKHLEYGVYEPYSFTPINNTLVTDNNKRKDNRIIKYICKEFCDNKEPFAILEDYPIHKYTSLEQVACKLYSLCDWMLKPSICTECELGPINSGNKCPLCKYVNKNYNKNDSFSKDFNEWDGSFNTLFVAPIIRELQFIFILVINCNLPNEICRIIIKYLTKNILYSKSHYHLLNKCYNSSIWEYNDPKKKVFDIVRPLNSSYDYQILDHREIDEYAVSSEESDWDSSDDDGYNWEFSL